MSERQKAHERRKLFRLYNIQPSYADLWGAVHGVDDEQLEQVLAALGAPTDTRSALRAREDQISANILQPVRVCHESGRPVSLFLTLPVDLNIDELEWSLELESGELSSGKLVLHTLEPWSRRRVGEREFVRYRLSLAAPLLRGYHRFVVHSIDDKVQGEQRIIVAPLRAYEASTRAWGITCQLFSLRHSSAWGIGDFLALQALVERAGRNGAAFVGINPLHALSLVDARSASPYSPSSRLLINPLYISFPWCAERLGLASRGEAIALALARQIQEAEQKALIDYPLVFDLKMIALAELFHETWADAARDAFLEFYRARREDLEAYFAVEQLPLHLRSRLEAGHSQSRVHEFLAFLQWIAHEQLAAVQQLATDIGMSHGLFIDLALAPGGGGADVRRWSDSFCTELSAGCPPDEFNLLGQNWGLPVPHPILFRSNAYEPFIQALRSNMRNAGIIRIDHVMSLFRLYAIPQQMTGDRGVYLRYALSELMAIVRLESQRNHCVVVGEDLGTVPAVVRQEMAHSGVLNYSVFWFERDESGFVSPSQFPSSALTTLSTHDLPTVRGYWRGRDNGWKHRLHLFPSEAAEQKSDQLRKRDRTQLQAFVKQRSKRETLGDFESDLLCALAERLSESPSRLVALQFEDIDQQVDQANLPGTVDEHPNWRRRAQQSVEQIASGTLWRELSTIFRESGRSSSREAKQDVAANTRT